MGLKHRDGYRRHSRRVTRSRRWAALRLLAQRRDNWQCVSCGARGRLEVDHIEPVRDRPDLAFALDNLQCLCPGCHARKTREEVGLRPVPPERQRWHDLVREMQKPIQIER